MIHAIWLNESGFSTYQIMDMHLLDSFVIIYNKKNTIQHRAC